MRTWHDKDIQSSEAQFIKKLSNTEAELKKSVAYKKHEEKKLNEWKMELYCSWILLCVWVPSLYTRI